MIIFQVKDMTCRHCVETITKALTAVDKDAKLAFDMEQRLVTIEAKAEDADRFRDGIKDAGYSPLQVRAESPCSAASGRAGCGCAR